MSKQLKCCKQTSALDVATQWACAELLQRWVCCITTTELSLLLCHHKRDWIACMTQDAGRTKVEGVKGSGKGHSLGVTGGGDQCSAVGHYSSAPDTLKETGSITLTLLQYSQYCFFHIQ